MCVLYPPGSIPWSQMPSATRSRTASNAFTRCSPEPNKNSVAASKTVSASVSESLPTHTSPLLLALTPRTTTPTIGSTCPPTPTCASSRACSTTSKSPMCSSSARLRSLASTSGSWTTERTRYSSCRICACWATSTTCCRRVSPSMSRIRGGCGELA